MTPERPSMIGEGEQAPRFELPAVVDGAIESVALDDQLADNVVVLAFYPGDFNPACRDGTTGLDSLDLVTMQREVVALGISGDSVHSHRAFADQYDLALPLLSDVTGTVAAEYGVAVESDRHVVGRAIVVVAPTGDVRYTWLAGDREELPDVAEIQGAVGVIDDGATARARYRAAHSRYVEGRRVFTGGMNALEDREWLVAKRDFERAHDELAEAAERLGTAVQFADSDVARRDYDHAQEKARALGQAAGWLTEAAGEFARGNGAVAERLQQDAEQTIETVRGMGTLIDPDDAGASDGPADQPGPESTSGRFAPSAVDTSDDGSDGAATDVDEGEIELDLTDPTEGASEADGSDVERERTDGQSGERGRQ
jgi:peroxiredoxin